MSAEEYRTDMERALQRAVADDVDPDELDAILDDMQDRVERLRIVGGGGTSGGGSSGE